MNHLIKIVFLLVALIFFTVGCKKKEAAFEIDQPETYTVTGKIRSYHCYNVTNGYVYLNGEHDPSGSTPKASIQPDGSFTFTYSTLSDYTHITITYPVQNYNGVYLSKKTRTVVANQNCDIGTYDFNSLSTFYVRFRSLSNSLITNVYLNSQTHTTHTFPNPYTPAITNSFRDTTLIFTHDRDKGWWLQDWTQGYDPTSEITVTHLPISFSCTHNNIQYNAQKSMLKCNTSPTDTLYINLP